MITLSLGVAEGVPANGRVSLTFSANQLRAYMTRHLYLWLTRGRDRSAKGLKSPSADQKFASFSGWPSDLSALSEVVSEALHRFANFDIPDLTPIMLELAAAIAVRRAVAHVEQESPGSMTAGAGALERAIVTVTSDRGWPEEIKKLFDQARLDFENIVEQKRPVGAPKKGAKPLTKDQSDLVDTLNDLVLKKPRRAGAIARKLRDDPAFPAFNKLLEGTSDPLKKIRRFRARRASMDKK